MSAPRFAGILCAIMGVVVLAMVNSATAPDVVSVIITIVANIVFGAETLFGLGWAIKG